ncbi:hypothetical protein V5F41_12245 [Xanthobacter autotrophicus]|uniref:hypothetical protein n=1 Tax=Xanthobacter autotrophicus TaxID=280 RepID=UPI003727183D
MALLAFACWRLVALEAAPDTRVAETVAWGWVLLILSVALGYLGFATVQDVAAIFATRSGTPYMPPPEPFDGPDGRDGRERPPGRRDFGPPHDFAG